MNGGPIPLSALDLALATGLVAVAGLISLWMRLRLERRLMVAAVRTVVQLLLVGYVLRYVFEVRSPVLIVGVALIMLLVAALTAVRRPSRSFTGISLYAFLTLVLSATLTSYTVTALIIGVEPWYRPQYLIPLLGMILGNGLTGVSLSLDSLLEALHQRRHEVENDLALGASRWEAATPPLREAVRRGMIPVTNAMMVVGVVSLPGMMTGQILAGADPLRAVKYQILVMFMIAAATSLSCIGIGTLTCQRLFNHRHQLLADRIRRRHE